MEFEGEGDRTFNQEEVYEVVKESVQSSLGNAVYTHSKVTTWQATIVENALKRLAALNKPFKYVVTCMISQNTGGATHTAHTCFWDAETDGFTKYRFENPTMVCLTTVYGMGI
mmetsp:Transcript_4474/g.8988  ORF Transcript_4474/g.8988 Transcript_4474/m.8988 type:complete len:113 (-) Transcript_4474:372-710(-)|eukprot:CAMPEP_0181313336 /NCGR_PEP_ID=MMETSP1101-20121128/14194_1 /TAXON_ID=46948 /ORGANISM="Rhodomonas abbreviata, Strain Caron Lab Isolate" /LENGTH=112 /DNA_ID=CAMNT_0023420283 /DNA_START=209 /DNA_END=547 /DNA_ORIENTATION=+